VILLKSLPVPSADSLCARLSTMMARLYQSRLFWSW